MSCPPICLPDNCRIFVEGLLPTGETKIGFLRVRAGLSFVCEWEPVLGLVHYAITDIVRYIGYDTSTEIHIGMCKNVDNAHIAEADRRIEVQSIVPEHDTSTENCPRICKNTKCVHRTEADI